MTPLTEIPESLRSAELSLLRIGRNPDELAWRLAKSIANGEAAAGVENLKQEAGFRGDGDELERLVLWRAAQQSLPQIQSLPVADSVRNRLEQDLRQLHLLPDSVIAGSYAFERGAKLAVLQRFPAGPMEWEPSGIPRSCVIQAGFLPGLRLLAFTALRLGGFSPCFFMHLAPAPRNRALSISKEVLRTYHRMVRSLKLQPAMRGLVANAWFHDPAALKDHPHLRILSIPYLEYGGLITPLGVAPASSGVLEGNAKRGADYISGKIRYRYGLAIWPRDAAIEWADAHPQLSDELS